MDPIGKVISLVNPIMVESPKGRRWKLYEGNNIFLGDTLFLGQDNCVKIELNNDDILTLKDQTSWTPTPETCCELDDFCVTEASLSGKARTTGSTDNQPSIIENLLQQLLVQEVTNRQARAYTDNYDIIYDQLVTSDRSVDRSVG